MHIGIPKSPAGLSSASHSPRSPSPLNPASGPYIELDDMKDVEHDGGHRGGPDARDNLDPLARNPNSPGGAEDFVNSWWLFEGLAWFMSAAAMAVMIVTLYLANEKPLPHWPMQITLNSFISVLATITKAAMVVPLAEGISQLKWLWFKKAGVLKDIQTFDEASRGMWGSLKLLLSTKGVHLAKLGAFLTVFSLAVDPFIQQVVTYPIRLVPSGLNATIPVAESYSDYAPGGIMALKEPTLSMKAAVYSGLFDTNSDPLKDFELTPYCATGNCTWSQPYQSLAVCSKCANVTDSLKTECDDSFGTKTCSYKLPNGFLLDGFYRGRIYMNATGAVDSINFNGTQSTITTLTTIRGIHDLSSTNLLGAVAMECVLYYCVNSYEGSVTEGNFTEKVVSSITNSTEPQTGDNVTIADPDTKKEFVVEYYAWQAVNQFFWNLWDGNVTGSTGEHSASNEYADAIYQLGDNGYGNGYPKPGGENTTIQALAKSMTKLLRTQSLESNANYSWGGNIQNSSAVGMAWKDETFVHVRWMWLIFPIALQALTLIFLLGTILRSNASGVAVWKSSTLALLHLRLIDESRNGNGGMRQNIAAWGSGKLGDLNKWANSSQVQLQRSDTGMNEFRIQQKH